MFNFIINKLFFKKLLLLKKNYKFYLSSKIKNYKNFNKRVKGKKDKKSKVEELKSTVGLTTQVTWV